MRDKAFKTPSDLKCDGYQRELASMVYKFIDKKSAGSGVATVRMNLQMKFIGRPGKRREEKFIHLLETIFGVLI